MKYSTTNNLFLHKESNGDFPKLLWFIVMKWISIWRIVKILETTAKVKPLINT